MDRADQERAAPAQQPVAWRCDECGCASYARMDERKPEGGFGPSPLVRCVNCKKVHNVPAASEPELRAEIVRLTRERDEALSRVEELEAEAETVSAEFEGDCWKALRSLLSECNFDWRDVEPDGVTADDAREHISTTLDELEKGETRNRERAEAADSRVEALSAEVGTARAEAFEEAALIAEAERKQHDTGGGFDSQPAHAAAFRIRDAIRSRAALDKGACEACNGTGQFQGISGGKHG